MAALLVGLSFVMGPVQLLKLYGVPYWVSPPPLTTFLAFFFFVLTFEFSIGYADFCHVVGFSNLLTSPWA